MKRAAAFVASILLLGTLAGSATGAATQHQESSPAVARPDSANAMAVDADAADGDVDPQASRFVGDQFQVAVAISGAPTPYQGYDLVVTYGAATLSFVATHDLDGDTTPESWEYTGLGGMILNATVSHLPDTPTPGTDLLQGSSATVSGTTTATGSVVIATFECVAAGTTTVHLVTQSEATGYTTTRDTGGAVIPTDLADAVVTCSSDADGDGMPDSYEASHPCLDPGTADGGLDPDGDWLSSFSEFLLGTGPCLDDTDSDGCADSEEMDGATAPKPGHTGPFDPLDPLDFYDVPVPARPDPTPSGSRSSIVNLGDVLAVLFYVGANDDEPVNGNGVDYDSTKDGDISGDTVVLEADDQVGLEYDRSPSAVPNPPWNAGPPNGAITIGDVLAVLAQVGLDCTGPP